jgi:hypothetical protein
VIVGSSGPGIPTLGKALRERIGILPPDRIDEASVQLPDRALDSREVTHAIR